MKKVLKPGGFTLIELLIVIGIIAILAAIIFVALNPLKRFQDARDAARYADVNAIITAIKIDQIDNGGSYLPAVSGLAASDVYMIVDGAMNSGCADHNANCDTDVTSDTHCVNLDGLVTEGYMGDVPVSPAGAVTWDEGAAVGDEGTGYTIQRESTGIITIRACESENTDEISVVR